MRKRDTGPPLVPGPASRARSALGRARLPVPLTAVSIYALRL